MFYRGQLCELDFQISDHKQCRRPLPPPNFPSDLCHCMRLHLVRCENMKRLTVAALSFVGSKKKRTPPVEHQSKECGHPDKSPTGSSFVSKNGLWRIWATFWLLFAWRRRCFVDEIWQPWWWKLLMVVLHATHYVSVAGEWPSVCCLSTINRRQNCQIYGDVRLD